jgi:hypothetical protein
MRAPAGKQADRFARFDEIGHGMSSSIDHCHSLIFFYLVLREFRSVVRPDGGILVDGHCVIEVIWARCAGLAFR